MNEVIVNSIKLTLISHDGGYAVLAVDMNNKHRAVLKLNARNKFYPVSNTFPKDSKRYYEMLYVAEVNKERLYGQA